MTFHVFEQPLDGVVCIGAFVDGFRVAPVAHLPLHHELALGMEASADVLEREDVSVGDQVRIARAQGLLIRHRTVGRALQQDRQTLPRLARREAHGMQLHAVPYWNHGVGLDESRIVLRASYAGKCPAEQSQSKPWT